MIGTYAIHETCGKPWHLCTCCGVCDQLATECDCEEADDEDAS